MAKVYAEYISDRMIEKYSKRTYLVQIIAEDGVDGEPLELRVTFSKVT